MKGKITTKAVIHLYNRIGTTRVKYNKYHVWYFHYNSSQYLSSQWMVLLIYTNSRRSNWRSNCGCHGLSEQLTTFSQSAPMNGHLYGFTSCMVDDCLFWHSSNRSSIPTNAWKRPWSWNCLFILSNSSMQIILGPLWRVQISIVNANVLSVLSNSIILFCPNSSRKNWNKLAKYIDTVDTAWIPCKVLYPWRSLRKHFFQCSTSKKQSRG